MAHSSSATPAAAATTDACGASLGQGDRLTGERHRWQRLADRVEEAVEHVLAGDRRRPHETSRTHRTGEHLTGGATQQRPIEVEECSGTRRSHRIRLRTRSGPASTWPGPGRADLALGRPENGKDPAWGIRVSQPGNVLRLGDRMVDFPSSGTWGVFALRSACESMHVNKRSGK